MFEEGQRNCKNPCVLIKLPEVSNIIYYASQKKRPVVVLELWLLMLKLNKL